MQFPVPQNIDLEDKIVGPLTLRQFLYLLVGGSIDYLLLQKLGTHGNTTIALIIGIPIGLLSIGLAFLKIQDRPLGDVLIALIIFSIRPKQRVWHREPTNKEGEVVTAPKINKDTEEKVMKKSVSREDVANLAQILDTGGAAKGAGSKIDSMSKK